MELTDSIRDQIKQQLVARPESKERPNRQRRTSSGLWARPFHSESLGVSPEQIKEAQAHLRSHGITADFDKEGRCIVTSDKQYREVAKACGMWTGRDGFSGRTHDGRRIATGREQADGQRRVREKLERWANE